MDIKITFINQSYDNSNVVVFQKNVATSFDATAVAWRILTSVGRGWQRQFLFPMDFYVGARDSWGNFCNSQLACNGQKWDVVRSRSGDVLSLDPGAASSFSEVEIKN